MSTWNYNSDTRNITGPDGHIICRVGDSICAEPSDIAILLAAPDLLAACKGIFRAIENGELVRDISKDCESDWALRMVRLTKDLAAMQQAITRAEGKEVA